MYNTIYPGYVKPYTGYTNRQVSRKSDEDKNSRTSQNAENNINKENQNQKSSYQNPSVFPNGEKTAIDYTKRTINISQVLSDFRNTSNAIGAPDEIKQEVSSYLTLVENQSKKSNPNEQIIKSNLRNASQILDEYITDTLKKPSKVVENWVDALFLQHIDYKAEAPLTEESETQTISGEEDRLQHEEENPYTPSITESETNDYYVPEDKRLKSMFIQAKKYAAIDNKEQALYSFQQTAEYAEEIGDIQTAAMAYYEQGRLYDEFNSLEDALYSYNIAAKNSPDDNIKARAHLSMGKIYDDYVNFEPAANHYFAAVSFAGEADNLSLQTKVFTNLAQLHANRYDKDNTMLFMGLTDTIADETKNNRLKGIALASNARCCEKLNDKAKALEYYGKSAKSFGFDNYYEGLAKDYTKAADIMIEYGNKAKAKKLLSKAFVAIQKCDNPELKQEITDKITSM